MSTNQQRIPTIVDIARIAGTNRTSVSVVLNGGRSSSGVSEATRERILAVARELDYQPNVMARGLKSVRFKSLGVSFQSLPPGMAITLPYSSALLGGIVDHAHKYAYNVTLFHKQWLDAKQSAAGFRGQGIDGFLIVAPANGSDVVPGLTALGIPVTVISASSGGDGAPSVDLDNAKGVRLALDHLLTLGHRRIGLMIDDPAQYDIAMRRDTFLTVLAEAGISVPPEYVRIDENNYAAGSIRADTRAMLSLPKPPTAILTTNDAIAFEAMLEARELGIAIPEQLSIIGFDDYPKAEFVSPPLTTVRQPLFSMGQAAARLLIALVEGQEVTSETRLFAPELIVRESTAIAAE